MSEPLFDIIFRGDIVIGHNIQDVKQRLSQLFKIEAAKVDALFAGGAVPLKRKVDKATAEKYKGVLAKAGAQVQVRPSDDGSTKPAAKPKPRPQATQPNPDQAKTSANQTPKKLTLKERLELQEAEAKKAAESKSSIAASTAGASDSADDSGLSLAPVGSVLGGNKQDQQAPKDIDVSAISLKPMQGDLLEASEKTPAPTATVEPGNYGIAEVGAEILQESERPPAPTVDIEFSDFDIAEVGADLLEAAHKLALPDLEINTDELSLAPVGSDMGEKKKDPPPPPPDTSSLSLSK